jgi:hypothetical protein
MKRRKDNIPTPRHHRRTIGAFLLSIVTIEIHHEASLRSNKHLIKANPSASPYLA